MAKAKAMAMCLRVATTCSALDACRSFCLLEYASNPGSRINLMGKCGANSQNKRSAARAASRRR